MESTFNMGVGMFTVVSSEDADRAMAYLTGRGVEAWQVIDDLVPRIKASPGCLHVQVLTGGDDVVGRDLVGHQARSPVAALVDSPCMASLSSSRAIVMRCTSEAPS